MNYIKRIQAENDAAQAARLQVEQRIQDFRAFLASPKFVGTESDGSRKDWISTGDVDRFLSTLLDA